MAVKQISPEEAKALLDSGDGYIYVDVRSLQEFEQGHPAGAYNVPYKHVNPEMRMLQENPDFLSVMQASFPTDAKLLLGCATGIRSNTAGYLLEQHGYTDLSNIQAGFSGQKDMMGNIIKAGWQQLKYPVESGDGKNKGYKALSQKKEQ